MTRQEILDALDEILATGTGYPKLLFRQDIQELRDDLERDLFLFPKEEPCPTSPRP